MLSKPVAVELPFLVVLAYAVLLLLLLAMLLAPAVHGS